MQEVQPAEIGGPQKGIKVSVGERQWTVILDCKG